MTIFQAAARPTFTAPVEIIVPGNGDDGAQETHEVVIEFRRLPRTELAAFQRREIPVADAMKEVVVGWRGLLDTRGADVSFSGETLDALLEIAAAPLAIYDAFLKYSYGAARKN